MTLRTTSHAFWLSLALTALFGGIPFAIVHLLLRWLGHH